jgi:uncharacterized membrane protein
MGLGILFPYRLANILLVVNGYILLSFILMVLLTASRHGWLPRATQTNGIDNDETFSHVAKISSIRVLISIAVNLDWAFCQLDVKNVFLHGDLLE